MKPLSLSAITFIALLLAAGANTATALAGQQLMVAYSKGASYTQGQVIDGDTAITLPDGAALVLIGEGETVHRLKGPFSGKIEAKTGSEKGGAATAKTNSASFWDKASRFFKPGKKKRKRVAATRGIGAGATRTVWQIDVHDKAPQCLLATGQHTLWRKRHKYVERLHITSGAQKTKLLWKAYQPTVAWPQSMALTDKGRYAIAFESDDTKNTLQVRILPASLKNDDARLIWMIAHGKCAVQARLLAKALAPQ